MNDFQSPKSPGLLTIAEQASTLRSFDLKQNSRLCQRGFLFHLLLPKVEFPLFGGLGRLVEVPRVVCDFLCPDLRSQFFVFFFFNQN